MSNFCVKCYFAGFSSGSPVKVPHATHFESMLPMRNSGLLFDLSNHKEREHGGAEGGITTASDIHEGQRLTSETPVTSHGGVETCGSQNIPKEFFSG